MQYVKAFGRFLLVCLLLLFVGFALYRIGYNRYYANEMKDLDEKLNGKGVHDLLFIGSSRALYDINPRVVDSIAGIDSYNIGIEGARFIEMNMVLQAYLRSHPAPKYLVMDVPASGFDPWQRPFFNPNIYYPFLNNEVVFSTMKEYKHVYMLKYLPFTQMTEADDATRQAVLSGLFGGTHSKPTDFYKGYMNYGNDTLSLPYVQTFFNLNVPVANKQNESLRQIIQTCKEKNIRVMMVFPPVYRFITEKLNPDFLPTVQAICDTNGFAFRNYYQIPLCGDHHLFADHVHLNKSGADSFSAVLARDIIDVFKPTLKKETAQR